MKHNKHVNDFNPSTRAYYNSLKSLSPISKEEERDLLERAKNGDSEARENLIKANLRFVFEMAKSYAGKGATMNDLISEGNMELIKCIDKFELEHDVRFVTYAVYWIRHAMSQYLKKSQKYDEVNVKISNNSEASNNSDDVEDEKLTVIDVSFGTEDNEVVIDSDANIYSEMVRTATKNLTKKEKFVVEHYYGLNGNEQENLLSIGKMLGVSGERARQIKNLAMKKMRTQALISKIHIK